MNKRTRVIKTIMKDKITWEDFLYKISKLILELQLLTQYRISSN